MKQKKRRLAIFLVLNLISCLLPSLLLAAPNDRFTPYAEKLNQIGVFSGTENGFELSREPTRLEGLAMLVRLLGKEAEASSLKNESSPFADVPDWGTGYINYAYNNKLANGIDGKRFGAVDKMSATQYVTFILRALGYSDAKGDFQYDQALSKAETIGLLDKAMRTELESSNFVRGHIAEISYSALKMNVKDRPINLLQKLIDEGAISSSTAQKAGILATESYEPTEPTAIEKVTFKDPGLEAVVRAALGNKSGDMYSNDMLGLKQLDSSSIPHTRIRSLDGIEALRNMTQLSLPDNLITDLHPLSGLSQLTSLNLSTNRIEDLSPLKGLSGLEDLALSDNFVRQIEPLSSLTKLKSLGIASNSITNIDPLSRMDRMQYFHADLNAISSIETIRTMKALTNVSVDGNPIADMSPMEGKQKEGSESIGSIEMAGKLARAIVQKTVHPGMTDLEKETAIHDYITDTVNYDYQEFSNGVPTKTRPHDLYGALIENYAVCEGYARAMMVLGRMSGLDIIYIRGDTGGIGHAWNMIRLDGTYYHVDPTWDDADDLWGGRKPQGAEQLRIVDLHRRNHFNVSQSQRMYEIRWDFERYPAAAIENPTNGGNQVKVSINSEIPANRDMIVWLYLDLRYNDNGVETGKSVQLAKVFDASTAKLDATFDVPSNIPLGAGKVSYVLSYELYDVSPYFAPVNRDFMFTDNGFTSKASKSTILHANDHLDVTLFKVGSTGVSFNQAEVKGTLDSYALNGSSFAYTQKVMENTIPLSYLRQVVNTKEVTLPPNSAIYVSEVFHGAEFDHYSRLYLYGEQAVAANHTSETKVLKPGEIVYTMRPSPTNERTADVNLRLSVFDGEFKETEYQSLADQHKVLFQDNWIKPLE